MAYHGAEWEIQTSESNAKKYLKGKPLPRMGYESEIMQKRDNYGFICRLCILNISGVYFVACSNVERKQWTEFFGFTLESKKSERS